MRKRGRPVLGAISGFFLGLLIGVDLLIFGVIALDSILLLILPLVGLLIGIAVPLALRKKANRPQETTTPALDSYVPPPPVEPAPPADPAPEPAPPEEPSTSE